MCRQSYAKARDYWENSENVQTNDGGHEERRYASLDGELSGFFGVEQGVPHGRALSPILFHFLFSNDGVLRVVEVVRHGVEVGDRKVSGLLITGGDFTTGTSDTPEGFPR